MADLQTLDVFALPRDVFEQQYRQYRMRWLAERNAGAKALAAMHVGETRLMRWRELTTYRKQLARHLTGAKDSNWSARHTQRCVYVTRTR